MYLEFDEHQARGLKENCILYVHDAICVSMSEHGALNSWEENSRCPKRPHSIDTEAITTRLLHDY